MFAAGFLVFSAALLAAGDLQLWYF